MSFENTTLKIGEKAPGFCAPALLKGEFVDIECTSFRNKYLVIIFYPADFSFVCPTELIAFSDRLADFTKVDCQIIGVSCDSQYSHLAWYNMPKKEGGLGQSVQYPLLADRNGRIAREYGVYLEKEGNAYRGQFILDREQKLRHMSVNDMSVGRSVDETLRLVTAFQFADENGVVCPAGWSQGKDTIKAEPEMAKEYFKRHA